MDLTNGGVVKNIVEIFRSKNNNGCALPARQETGCSYLFKRRHIDHGIIIRRSHCRYLLVVRGR